MSERLFLASLFLILSHIMSAQDCHLKGVIRDVNSEEPLIGASILVKESGNGTVSDQDGNFEIRCESGNNITLQVYYLGYIQEELLVTGNNTDLEIYLTPDAISLNEVEVTGQMDGTIRAFVEQKEAANIKNVISADQIASFPDMTAADAMQRIPGISLQRDKGEGKYVQLRGTPPELTNFNVNGEQIPSPEGNVRYVGIDIIPADQIEFIEVTKVMTPDMDADGIGGSVNIKTKEPPRGKTEIRTTMASGYSHLRQQPSYQLQFSYGQRLGKLGFQLNSSFLQRDQSADNLEYSYAKGPFFGSQDQGQDNYFVQYREVQLRHYDVTRTRIGVSPSFKYHLNDNSHFYLMGMFNSFKDDEVRRRLIYDLDDALSETYYLFGGIEHDVKDRVKTQTLGTLSLGGEHLIGNITIDYQLFYAYANETEPERMEAVFDNPGQAITINFDRTDPDYPRATFPNPDNAVNVTRYDAYEMDELLFEDSDIIDENITPRVNIKIPYAFNSGSTGFLKFGGKLRYKEKERDIQSHEYGAYFEESKIYPGIGPPLSLADVHDGFREDNLLDEGYELEYMPSSGMLKEFFEFYPQHFIFDKDATRINSFGEDYKAREKIYAAYGMFQHDFSNLMVLGGLRYECTDINYNGNRIVTDRGRFQEIQPLSDKRTHEFLLPQIQLKYTLNEAINIRGALTYTYSRPNFEDVLPYREEDRDEVKFGNPDLRYPQSTNVDFLVERYFLKSIFSGGLFFKRIDDFIFFFKRFAHEGDPSDYGLVEITKALNGNRAFIYGAEFQSQFKFDFLNGFWKNFGLYANYTYTYSEAYIHERQPANYSDAIVIFGEDDLEFFTDSENEEKISLPGQTAHAVNLAIFFDSPKFFARLSANYQDDFLVQLGADPDLDEYYDASLRLDFTANYSINDHIRVFADMINITNAPLKYYLGDTDRIQQLEFYSWWTRFGVKLSF